MSSWNKSTGQATLFRTRSASELGLTTATCALVASLIVGSSLTVFVIPDLNSGLSKANGELSLSSSQMSSAAEQVAASSQALSQDASSAAETNILALKAAVEAAPAGEAATGFAVVAGEVCNLAQCCSRLPKTPPCSSKTRLPSPLPAIGASIQVARAVLEMSESFNRIQTLVREISSGSNQQRNGMGQISLAAGQLSTQLPAECHPGSVIKRIKFISIPVADQDRALQFYTEKLGFQLVLDQPMSKTQRWIELSIPGAETGVVLFTMDGQEDRIGSVLNTSWQVDDLDGTYQTLAARGVQFAKPPEKQPWGIFAIMEDSEGNQIVLSSETNA